MSEEVFKSLRDYCGELADLRGVTELLEWDQQVNMPAGGSAGRARAVEAVGRAAHGKLLADRLGELLDRAIGQSPEPGSDDAALLRILCEERSRALRVPTEFVGEFARVSALAFDSWSRAREADDFTLLRADLEQVFALRRAYAGFFPEADTPYDALLADFEPGMTTAETTEIFDALRPALVGMVRELAPRHSNRPAVDGCYDAARQMKLARIAAETYGFDFARGRMDRSEHPFTCAFGRNDVRITTRCDENNLTFSLYSVFHETGHALYEQSVDPAYDRTELGCVRSLALHESQSRFWENMVGRSAAFLRWFHPGIREVFPEVPGCEDFIAAVNTVRPSLIRTEADEVTYNLHIMLRMELEIAVIERRAEVADLPALWREKMREYLGIEPVGDRDGVLQDVHWPTGAIGYFPTYALGNVIGGQVWAAMRRELGDVTCLLASGRLAEVREYLTEHIYRFGAKYTCGELVKKVTGEAMNPGPYLAYLREKFY